MKADAFIARRLRFKGATALAATAVSSFVMIVAVAVAGGFRSEVSRSVRDFSADVVLSGLDADLLGGGQPIPAQPSFTEDILAVSGVESLTPAVCRGGIIKAGNRIEGALFKSWPGMGSLQVDVPSALAAQLSLAPGDKLLCYFVDEKVKARKFTIRGTYDPGVDVEKAPILRCNIDDLRRLGGLAEDQAALLEVRLRDALDKPSVMRSKADEIAVIAMTQVSPDEPRLVATSAPDRYRVLFDWLDVIDVNVAVILILMSIVAGFNMISALLILLMRSVPTIGILKTMGMTDRDVRRVYLRISGRQVGVGLLTGNALALLLCFVQSCTHILKLNPANYFVSFVPIKLNVIAIAGADILAFAVIMALLAIGAHYISHIDPAESAKSE
ncbi:MAG: ABC transporter permease [Bacteroidales bacterium]|nr:ABC transporter permease [Candidatus Cryptobacteroides aphodequi]